MAKSIKMTARRKTWENYHAPTILGKVTKTHVWVAIYLAQLTGIYLTRRQAARLGKFLTEASKGDAT